MDFIWWYWHQADGLRQKGAFYLLISIADGMLVSNLAILLSTSISRRSSIIFSCTGALLYTITLGRSSCFRLFYG
jgi:hypothetical protein